MTLPVALDTNVLVRLLVNDDPVQAEQAAELIDASAACFVPITVALARPSPSPSGAGRAGEASPGLAPAGTGLCRCAASCSQRGVWSTDSWAPQLIASSIDVLGEAIMITQSPW